MRRFQVVYHRTEIRIDPPAQAHAATGITANKRLAFIFSAIVSAAEHGNAFDSVIRLEHPIVSLQVLGVGYLAKCRRRLPILDDFAGYSEKQRNGLEKRFRASANLAGLSDNLVTALDLHCVFCSSVASGAT